MASLQTVLVSGANGRTGNLVLDTLWEQSENFTVKAVVASSEGAKKLADKGLPLHNIHICDISEGATANLEAAFLGCDAAIIATSAVPELVYSSLFKVLWGKITRQEGVRPDFTWKRGQLPEQVDWLGQKYQIDAAKRAGVKHIVLISSMGGTKPDYPLNKLGNGNILIWKRKAEQYLMASGIAYSIIHPGGLTDGRGGEQELILSVDDKLLEDGSPGRRIPRADVAALAVQCLLCPEALNRSFDAASKEPGSGSPTTDFRKLLSDLEGNCKYS